MGAICQKVFYEKVSALELPLFVKRFLRDVATESIYDLSVLMLSGRCAVQCFLDASGFRVGRIQRLWIHLKPTEMEVDSILKALTASESTGIALYFLHFAVD